MSYDRPVAIPEFPAADDFEPLCGRAFRTGDVALRLESIHRGAAQPGQGREPFTLVFTGPRARYLAQGTHHLLEETAGGLDIFLVPVGMTDDSFQYEAVFG